MSSSPSNPFFDTLILSGGANRGIMYGGAIKCLEDHGLLKNINTYVGTSIGALVAALLALGYTAGELEQVVLTYDMCDVKPHAENEVVNLFRRYACYSNQRKEDMIRDLIARKAESELITFKQLHDVFRITLVITVCCVDTGETEYLSHRTEPNMPIQKAVFMSTTIPLIFEPYEHKGHLYVDGGCFGAAYPVGWSDGDSGRNPARTLGLRLASDRQTHPVESVLQYLNALMTGVRHAIATGDDSVCPNTIDLVCELDSLQAHVPRDVKILYMREAYQTVDAWIQSLAQR